MKSKKIINFAITMGKKHKRLIYKALGLTLIIFLYSVFFQATYCWMRFGSPTFNGDWGSFLYSLPFNFVPFLIITIAALWSVWLTRNIAVLWKKIILDLLMASCIVIIVNILFLITTGLEINWGGTVFNGIMIWMGIEFWAVSLQRQRALIRESLLLKENAAHKLQLLQSYVNPHFLFNSLDMLCSMIELDEKKQSLEFIENLTAYYRGMLRRKNVMKVTVKDELETVFCYLKIVSQHYGDSLEISVTGNRDTDMMIVPFSIQLLIENVLKHNMISTAVPMNVTISIKDGEITVANPCHPKKAEVNRNTGMGLKYLHNMYAACNKKVEVNRSDSTFSVTIPAL